MANDTSEAPAREPEKKAKLLRVRVVEAGHPTVNVKVPIGVAKWGMKMAQASTTRPLRCGWNDRHSQRRI